MLAVAQRRLVETVLPQRDQNTVLVGAWNEHRVAVGRAALLVAPLAPFRAPGRRDLQLKPLDQFFDRVAPAGRPGDQSAGERRRVLAVGRHGQPGQPRPGAVRAGVAQSRGHDRVHQPVGDIAVVKRVPQQIPGLVIARRRLEQPARRQCQAFAGHLRADVVEHHGMQRVEARLLAPVLAGFVRDERGQAEVVVGVGGQAGGGVALCRPCPPGPGLGGDFGRVAGEADHHRADVGQAVAEDRAQEHAVADGVGFVGCVGFAGVGPRNCQGRDHRSHAYLPALRAASSFTTSARISSSDLSAMVAATSASTSSSGVPRARRPSLTGRTNSPALTSA